MTRLATPGRRAVAASAGELVGIRWSMGILSKLMGTAQSATRGGRGAAAPGRGMGRATTRGGVGRGTGRGRTPAGSGGGIGRMVQGFLRRR